MKWITELEIVKKLTLTVSMRLHIPRDEGKNILDDVGKYRNVTAGKYGNLKYKKGNIRYIFSSPLTRIAIMSYQKT